MIPKFSAVDFVSFYVEIPVMAVMYIAWSLIKRPVPDSNDALPDSSEDATEHTPLICLTRKEKQPWRAWWRSDVVNVNTVDLRRDEYVEEVEDLADDEERENRLKGRWKVLWRAYYLVA